MRPPGQKSKKTSQIETPAPEVNFGRILMAILMIFPLLCICSLAIILIEYRHIIADPIQSITMIGISLVLFIILILMLAMPRLVYRFFPQRTRRKDNSHKTKL